MNKTNELKPYPVTILVAEDNEGHAELILDSLHEAGVNNPMLRFRDGQEVIDYLDGKLEHKLEKGHAYLLLLDIRMPRMDGVEVLRRMKSHACWKNIPIIMLTTTEDPREVQGCYELGCNCYITKPIEFSKFSAVLRQLGLFLTIVHFPPINGLP